MIKTATCGHCGRRSNTSRLAFYFCGDEKRWTCPEVVSGRCYMRAVAEMAADERKAA